MKIQKAQVWGNIFQPGLHQTVCFLQWQEVTCWLPWESPTWTSGLRKNSKYRKTRIVNYYIGHSSRGLWDLVWSDLIHMNYVMSQIISIFVKIQQNSQEKTKNRLGLGVGLVWHCFLCWNIYRWTELRTKLQTDQAFYYRCNLVKHPIDRRYHLLVTLGVTNLDRWFGREF